METIEFEFETVECCDCGIVFQVSSDFDDNRFEDGRVFYCPNGHEQRYQYCGHDKREELERENAELKKHIRQLKCRMSGQNGLLDKIKVWLLGTNVK